MSMKYVKQFGIIIGITWIGEGLKNFLPFSIPGSIYGLILLFLLLQFRIIKLEQVKETGTFLVQIMPIMFIPVSVGLVNSIDELCGMLVPVLLAIVPITILVMVVAGKITDAMLEGRK